MRGVVGQIRPPEFDLSGRTESRMADLFQRSIHVILAHQAPSGAYIASPTFPVYRYCWFRDGSFTAYAMDLVGEHDSAHRFHDWAAQTILRHADKAARAVEKAQRGQPLDGDFLHTRYTAEGGEGPADWPNFQLDGLGTWLWSLAEHTHTSPSSAHGHSVPAQWQQAVDLVARYLAALWTYPCYDLWEEHPHALHPYTLAAIYAGLRAAEMMTDHVPMVDVGQIRQIVIDHAMRHGYIVKHIEPHRDDIPGSQPGLPVDASLLGVATPYRLLSPDDPLMQATVSRIKTDLHRPGGGLHRYLADTYYGGGEWVLLTAWLGWYATEVGAWAHAHDLLQWVENQADASGYLPEQVSHHLLAPERYGEWVARWGPPARPLLWSHAMYLILHQALRGH